MPSSPAPRSTKSLTIRTLPFTLSAVEGLALLAPSGSDEGSAVEGCPAQVLRARTFTARSGIVFLL